MVHKVIFLVHSRNVMAFGREFPDNNNNKKKNVTSLPLTPSTAGRCVYVPDRGLAPRHAKLQRLNGQARRRRV